MQTNYTKFIQNIKGINIKKHRYICSFKNFSILNSIFTTMVIMSFIIILYIFPETFSISFQKEHLHSE
jgi:hypothetical protein